MKRDYEKEWEKVKNDQKKFPYIHTERTRILLEACEEMTSLLPIEKLNYTGSHRFFNEEDPRKQIGFVFEIQGHAVILELYQRKDRILWGNETIGALEFLQKHQYLLGEDAGRFQIVFDRLPGEDYDIQVHKSIQYQLEERMITNLKNWIDRNVLIESVSLLERNKNGALFLYDCADRKFEIALDVDEYGKATCELVDNSSMKESVYESVIAVLKENENDSTDPLTLPFELLERAGNVILEVVLDEAFGYLIRERYRNSKEYKMKKSFGHQIPGI